MAIVADQGHRFSAADRRRLDGLVGNLPGSVVYRLLMDARGGQRLLYVSPAIEHIFGLSRDAVLEDVGSWNALLHPGEAARAQDEIEQAFRRGATFHLQLRYLIDGEDRVFDVHASPDPTEDGFMIWNGVATDVTEATEMRAERRRLLDLIEATPDMVAVVRPDMTIESLNAAARARLGVAAGAVSAPAWSFYGPAERKRFDDEILPALAAGEVWRGENELLTPDGPLPVEQIITVARDSSGAITHYATIMRDLTEQRAAEAARRAAADQVEIALREANHRLKNFFALVPALVTLSARAAASTGDLAEAVTHRIGALARSHSLTITSFSAEDGVALADLIGAVLEPYEDAADLFVVEGPEVRLAGGVASTIALTLHELATNAAKHGVFAMAGGMVKITWTVRPSLRGAQALSISWDENGGPPVAEAPAHQGFGTSLIDRLVRTQGGTLSRDWRREGLRVTVDLPRV